MGEMDMYVYLVGLGRPLENFLDKDTCDRVGLEAQNSKEIE